MMRKALVLSVSFFTLSLSILGQNYPSKWIRFTSGGYIYAIEQDDNVSGTAETVFINTLLDRARVNVAKQVSISVADRAKIVKQALNGVSSINYYANTTFSTDVTMRLLKTDTDYNPASKRGAAIAYLDNGEVCDYWSKEAERMIRKQDTELSNTRKMISLGYKEKAKPILEQLTTRADELDEPLVWLGLCSFPEDKYQSILTRYSNNLKQAEEVLLSLGHGITIFLDYHSDLFGDEYLVALKQLSAKLASDDRSFVENSFDADWIVEILVSAREGQATPVGNKSIYFSYVDVSTTIIKGSTNQKVYNDAFSLKGGDTRGFKQAASIACKDLADRLYVSVNSRIGE